MVSHQAKGWTSGPAKATGPSQSSLSDLINALTTTLKPVDGDFLCLNRAEKPTIILFIRELYPKRKLVANNFIYISFKIIIIG
jgi:hypothetical protein